MANPPPKTRSTSHGSPRRVVPREQRSLLDAVGHEEQERRPRDGDGAVRDAGDVGVDEERSGQPPGDDQREDDEDASLRGRERPELARLVGGTGRVGGVKRRVGVADG
ncbi:hypothetical protein, partial [Halogeometricum sp. CBA1124]|uniref:hypothetical protein n=1 Tax=Halogeometricum sp. CBA1124 TaxID=2668071 RepID=UPI001E51C01B